MEEPLAVSATRTVPTAPAAATPGTAAPVPGSAPRRIRPPRWLDLRLVLGVLLVLGSVLLGARVVAAADATVPVWSAAGDLAAGTVLAAGDLVAVDVRLDDVAGAYLATSTRPEGRTLARAVRNGELLPRTALEEPAELVQLALPVQAGYVPPGLDRGQVVDVYAVADPAAREGHLVVRVQVVRRSRRLGEREPAGEVVVVDVGLQHVADLQPALGDQVKDPVDVALGVHHDGDLAVGCEVAAVAETRGLDRLNLDHASAPALPRRV